MPVYDFICKECGDVTAKMLTLKEYEKFEKKCDKCNGELDRHWEMGTVFAQHTTSDNSKGGIFSKKFWKKNRWL